MSDEQLLGKAKVSFIYRAGYRGVRLTDKNWSYGMVFITNKNIWFSDSKTKKYNNIPLMKIKFIERKESWRAPDALHTAVVAIDHEIDSGDMLGTTLVAGPTNVINTVTYNIKVLIGANVKIEQNIDEIEKKLLVLIYTGVTDISIWCAVLGADENIVGNAYAKLKQSSLLDNLGKLTSKGREIASGLIRGE